MALRREGDMLASKYRIEALLGSGGMGDVYRATNTLVNREVAIKLLHIRHVDDPDLVERFVREARVANIVRHPNVVDVLDVDKDTDGSPFIVQELLTGQDLSKYLRERGRLTLDEIRELVMPVVDAVAAAHAQGVIHRDIKPANVFLATQRTVAGDLAPSSGRRSRAPRSENRVVPKLLDFGISKLRSADVRATDIGVLLGTPAYMAPELLHGVRDANVGSDVWALGVMLFELLAGRRPYLTPGPGIYVAIATTDPPPLETVAPDVDPEVARIVDRCLRRSVQERFASAGQLAQALSAALDGAQGRPPVTPLPRLEPLVPDLDLRGVQSEPTSIDVVVSVVYDVTLPSKGVTVEPQQTERMSSAPRLPEPPASQLVTASPATPRMTAPVAPQMSASVAPQMSASVAPQTSASVAPQTSASVAPRMSAPPSTPRPPPSSGLELGVAPSSSLRPPGDRWTPPSSQAPQPREELVWLGGVLVLGGVALAIVGVLSAFVGRAGGWAIVRPFAETIPQIVTAAQIGAALVASALVVRAFRSGLRRWRDGARGPAIAYAVVCGALVFAALQLARAC